MPTRYITIPFTAETFNNIDTAIANLDTMLTFAVNLTLDERRRISKIGPKKRVFIDRSFGYVSRDPASAPVQLLNMENYMNDYNIYKRLLQQIPRMNQIKEKLIDTATALGHQIYLSSLVYYKYQQKLADSNVAGAKTIIADLGFLFEKNTPKPEPNPVEEPLTQVK